MISPGFRAKAVIGKKLTEAFYSHYGRQLKARISTFNGRTPIEWARIGEGKKPCILFLHGFSDRKENFYFPAKYLSSDYDFILPDMPGFGKNTPDKTLAYTLDNYGAWLGEFLTQNRFPRVHLAGSSLGGAVCVKLALAHPDRIKTLSLIDPAGFFIPEKKSIYDEALEGVNIFEIHNQKGFEALRSRIFRKKPKLPVFVKAYMTDQAISNRNWYIKIFNDLLNIPKGKADNMESLSLNSACQKITQPTHIFWGRHDTLFPWQTADFLTREIKTARSHIFDHLGHVPHLEAPEQFAKILRAHLAPFLT